MTKQPTDRELINALSQAAYDTGADYTDFLRSDDWNRTPDPSKIQERTRLENVVVERLIVRDEKIKRLQAEIADLKREREMGWELAK
jgi:hypothetical protein